MHVLLPARSFAVAAWTLVALLIATGTAHAPSTAIAAPTDDAQTVVNESARLDASRITALGEDTPSPIDLAHAYARAHELTNCVSPSVGGLEDTYLAIKVHPLDGLPYDAIILELTFDQALQSAGKRINLLACDRT